MILVIIENWIYYFVSQGKGDVHYLVSGMLKFILYPGSIL